MIAPPPLNLSEEPGELHTLEFQRDGDLIEVVDVDAETQVRVLLWPASRAQDIAAALLRASSNPNKE